MEEGGRGRGRMSKGDGERMRKRRRWLRKEEGDVRWNRVD
jgi:hypothetical protein